MLDEDESVSRESLVNAGFYHAGNGRLRCAWCGGELAPFRCFGSLGPPLEVHRMYFPLCEHAASLEAAQNNTNMSPPSSPTPDPPRSQPVPESNEDQPNQSQTSGAVHNERLLSAGGTWRSLGVVSGGARHPHHAALAARLASFQRWPADRHQTPRALAEAGFFHTGTDDQVRCFYCDGGLGKWEAGDTPWSEHAYWFPHCGYVLLVKGQEFIDNCRNRTSVQRTFSAESGLTSRRRNPGVNFPVTESQVEECMESPIALAALGAGLDAARVRRALARRLRVSGLPFHSSEALIDAVLDEQLNEEAWNCIPQSQRLARDILAETLREFAPRSGIIANQWSDRPDSARSQSDTTSRSLSPVESEPTRAQNENDSAPNVLNVLPPNETKPVSSEDVESSPKKEPKQLTLEEENRQLKEARLCKVCMDSEVSVVFLPCGHLVSCGSCGAALAACPLCRAPVRALVRAYLA
ncbi:LOW QUALITY PROTEIN: baculoviral IAP repeat-containing protein 7-A-like [Manduca sexta]|uniref:LOW QUALITY PROTEIN: baculoviral IAP repeat-containing protein 7-A-like n=1 Tax=Manduca sexta TaxID=7130 RepID=UPI0018900FD4|nr:LOW QUALITY PROTEIN: baculoviral IAP repeat-containing protein 7-A-like [Manduca sexta]